MAWKTKFEIPAYLGNHRYFMALTYEMQKSAAYRALTARQQDLYYLAYREAHYSKRHPRNDFPDVDYLQGDDVCFLPFSVARANGLYTDEGKRGFILDRKRLVKLGFLEIVTPGGNGARNKTIYRLSCNWQQTKTMKRKRTKRIPAYLGNSEKFMALTYEMQKSAAYRALTARQRGLYYLAYREAHYSKRHPRNVFPDVDYLQGDDVCFLPFSIAIADDLYTEKGRPGFINDRKKLVELGFLEIITPGGNGARNKTIYRLSGKWQQIK